ncbi:LacI family DNA-binding transcriptional regulator [Burkholderia lata]|uniref:LacI family DNA-binding transcriptional regulator n=1 Tax=Burkholderia lata (strain ATCC 17760 / DSM 23089 / LMG 22485 / NCIMB 9086 / R18194 / 383) TaxID=482957 RepID=UPI001FC84A93|nr:LacI family DNA-binding transcriptional regulator [Burkholderia lata]
MPADIPLPAEPALNGHSRYRMPGRDRMRSKHGKVSVPKAPTISDVANLAQVSKATVSRYLNGNLALPPDTAKRVDDAIVALNFRQNSLARRLSKGSSETIGLAMPNVANPFFAELADEVEEALRERDYGLSLCITRNLVEREAFYLRWLDTRHLDGLIMITNRPDDGQLRQLIKGHRNIVLMDEDVPGTEVPKVFVNNIEGGYLATKHLLDAGHRRIAHVSGPRFLYTVGERHEGYCKALAEAGVPYDPTIVKFGTYERTFGQQAAAELLELRDPPTAVFAASDYLAVGMLETLRNRALDVPGYISIVGFDDMEFASLLMPPISTLRQSTRELGRTAVATLIDIISAAPDRTADATIQRLPVQLIERASVGAPRHG